MPASGYGSKPYWSAIRRTQITLKSCLVLVPPSVRPDIFRHVAAARNGSRTAASFVRLLNPLSRRNRGIGYATGLFQFRGTSMRLRHARFVILLPIVLAASPGVPPALAAGEPMSGLFRYMADAARFQECLTGRSVPVATEADYPALEAAYVAARAEPGAPVLVKVAGRVTERPKPKGDGNEAMLVVDRFLGIEKGRNCPMADADLRNTYWRLATIAGTTVVTPQDAREAHLILEPDEKVNGFGGCNGVGGAYAVDGDKLTFKDIPSTMMYCAGTSDLEAKLIRALEDTRTFSISGDRLELRGETGEELATLQAVYF